MAKIIIAKVKKKQTGAPFRAAAAGFDFQGWEKYHAAQLCDCDGYDIDHSIAGRRKKRWTGNG